MDPKLLPAPSGKLKFCRCFVFLIPVLLLLGSCSALLPVRVSTNHAESLPKGETVTVNFGGMVPRTYNGENVSGIWKRDTFIRIPQGPARFGVDVAATVTGDRYVQKLGLAFSYTFTSQDDYILWVELDKKTQEVGVGVYRNKAPNRRIDFIRFEGQ